MLPALVRLVDRLALRKRRCPMLPALVHLLLRGTTIGLEEHLRLSQRLVSDVVGEVMRLLLLSVFSCVMQRRNAFL
jgi:hypothetical protein